MKRSIISLCMVVLCVANAASAQQSARLETGVRVRVTPKQGDKIVGTVAGFDADSLRVTLDGTDYVSSTAARDIQKLEASTGRSHARGAFKNGAIGLIGGLAGGVAFGALVGGGNNGKSSCFSICTRGEVAAVFGLLGGGAGFIVGTIAGAATGDEGWVSASMPRR